MTDIYTHAVELASVLGIPEEAVADGVYLGRADRYLVYTSTAEPIHYGDDEPQVDRYAVYINIYVPLSENYTSWLKTARLTMEAQGYDDVTYEGQTVDIDDNKRHIVLNGLYDILREE